MVKNEKVIAVLREVPAKKLRIVDLSWQLITDGKLDPSKCTDRLPDINLAIAEAKAYIRDTTTAINAIRRIHDRA